MTITAARPTVVATAMTLRPFRHLNWQSMAYGVLGCTMPGLVVVLLLTLERGGPWPAIGFSCLVLAHMAAACVLALHARIVVDRDGLTAWTVTLRPVRIARSRVRKAVFRTVYTADGLDTREHLFLLDAQGTSVFRISDRWWRRDQMHAIAARFQVPIETVSEPMNGGELRQLPSKQLTWHERMPLVATLAVAAVVVADCTLAAALAVIALH